MCPCGLAVSAVHAQLIQSWVKSCWLLLLPQSHHPRAHPPPAVGRGDLGSCQHFSPSCWDLLPTLINTFADKIITLWHFGKFTSGANGETKG